MRTWLVGVLVVATVALGAPIASAGETWQEADITELGVYAWDFVSDPARGEVHAAVGQYDDRYPNSVVSVNRRTGAVVRHIPLGTIPTVIEMSDDGRYLFVGLLWSGSVARVDLTTGTVDLEIDLVHPTTPGVPVHTPSIVPLPGQPTSIAVAVVETVQTYPYEGDPANVVVYDGATPRPLTPDDAQSRLVRGDGATVLANNAGESPYEFVIGANGIELPVEPPHENVLDIEAGEKVAAYGDQFLFLDNPYKRFEALVIDYFTDEPVALPRVPLEGRAVVVDYDDSTGTVFYASETDYRQEPGSSALIEEIDPYTFLRFSRTIITERPTGVPDITYDINPWKIDRVNDREFLMSVKFFNGGPSGGRQLLRVDVTNSVDASPVGIVDMDQGYWALRDRWGFGTAFYFGNPGDYPFMGDWDCDGNETPGLYRQSDGYVYLRNSNSQGVADIKFFFGNPGDIPLAGDFNGDGCDTVSIYRPSEARFYIINDLGSDDGGLGGADYSFLFGNQGDKPVVGDWDGDGIDEVGLHRESTGLFYYRDSLSTGNASDEFYFGDPGDYFIAGDSGAVPDGIETPAIFRPRDGRIYFRYLNTQGAANGSLPTWGDDRVRPVAGEFNLLFELLSGNSQANTMTYGVTPSRDDSEIVTRERVSAILHDQRLVGAPAD